MKELIAQARDYTDQSDAWQFRQKMADALERLTAERDALFNRATTAEFECDAVKETVLGWVRANGCGGWIDELRSNLQAREIELDSLTAERDALTEENQRLLDQRNMYAQEVKTEQRLSFRTERDALWDALLWIATVNAMDYEYKAKARSALAGEKHD